MNKNKMWQLKDSIDKIEILFDELQDYLIDAKYLIRQIQAKEDKTITK